MNTFADIGFATGGLVSPLCCGVTSLRQMAKGPTAAVRLPQLPDQSMASWSIST